MAKKDVKQKEKESLEDYKAKWHRALADYQNLQKEVIARREEWSQLSEQQILEEFIPVFDNLKLSLNKEKNGQNLEAWLEGVKHITKQFYDVLKNHGIEEIKTVGELFDPKFHEAIGQEEVSNEVKESTITKEVSSGYTMKNKVIRAAKVIVAKKTKIEN